MPKAPPIHRQHKTAARHKARDTRPTAKARGYNARWARFSRAFLRANPLCEFCLGQGVVKAATITDHDAPHRGDEELFWENTFTGLCKPAMTAPNSAWKPSTQARRFLPLSAEPRPGVGQISRVISRVPAGVAKFLRVQFQTKKLTARLGVFRHHAEALTCHRDPIKQTGKRHAPKAKKLGGRLNPEQTPKGPTSG